MAGTGPFAPDRQVVVAVSGGADSMALAWLLRGWGEPLAVVIDHGLRTASGDEARATMARLAAIGIRARLMRIKGLQPGPRLAERARVARYDALLAACRSAGRPDLLVAHHRQDQQETAALRAEGGSGAAGLAGMGAVVWLGDARVARPLLGVAPGRLRATVRRAGLGWVEDPTNADPATGRGRLRLLSAWDAGVDTDRAGQGRRVADRALAEELAEHVAVFPTGHAEVRSPLSEAAWSALVWTVSGRAHPPPREGIRGLRLRGAGTLHGVRATRGLVMRELAAMAAPVPAQAGTVWDGRFRIRSAPVWAPAGTTIGALGTDAARLRRRGGFPSAVMASLPALRFGTDLLTVPHLAYPDVETCRSVDVGFCPSRPLAGAPFEPATGQAG